MFDWVLNTPPSRVVFIEKIVMKRCYILHEKDNYDIHKEDRKP